VDNVTALLAVPPELGKAFPDILCAISPAARHQGAPVAGPIPPAGFLSQPSLPRGHARRQAAAGNGEGPGGGAGGNVPSPQPMLSPRPLVSEDLTTWSWCPVFAILVPFH
jgi:hypothetical protein